MIEVTDLTKCFGQKTAVDKVSFKVGRGEVLGFLGPNGAGKSTTMRMITGFLSPTSGKVSIGGIDVLQSQVAARRLLGYLPENAPVYPEMTVSGFLGFIAEVRGFTGASKRERIDRTVESCFLVEVRHQTIGRLSKGYRQRVCFAQSILHNPDYLVMDEPTDGLDPNQKHEVRGMIREMAKNKTIILSTHILEEVDAVCDRALVIDSGKIVADDTPEGLKARSPEHGVVKLVFNSLPGSDVLQSLERLQGVRTLQVRRGREPVVTLFPTDPVAPPMGTVTRFLCEQNIPVKSLRIQEGRIEDVFRTITTQKA